MKPGFEDFGKDLFEPTKAIDTDLDDEIYADQLHSLLQRISPELEKSSNMKTFVDGTKNAKKTDEETIWDRIHGTFVEDNKPNTQKRNRQQLLKKLPHAPRGGVFEGVFQGPKVFRQSVMTQVIRKPDGTTETRRTVRDAEGNENTTVTKRTNDGKVETFTFPGNGSGKVVQKPLMAPDQIPSLFSSDRNVFVTKDGYAIPKLWWLLAEGDEFFDFCLNLIIKYFHHISWNTFKCRIRALITNSNLILIVNDKRRRNGINFGFLLKFLFVEFYCPLKVKRTTKTKPNSLSELEVLPLEIISP